jgi:plasmid stabilization system protein ParE
VTPPAYTVVEADSAFSDYVAISTYVEEATSDRALADRTVDAIRSAVASLGQTPQRGVPRDDLREGLRLLFFRRRTVIAYDIDKTRNVVRVLRVFYGSQDYEALLSSP